MLWPGAEATNGAMFPRSIRPTSMRWSRHKELAAGADTSTLSDEITAYIMKYLEKEAWILPLDSLRRHRSSSLMKK